MNQLARERSPYLLQHAHNPVDWFPWGDEAFQKAKAEDKPIFLSIGYSTCHWCHVMERESFESESIARVLNEHFVSIKVDREERPDVDRVYMAFVQATTGSGGWPMSVWLTPDLEPFHGGTYFPPDARWGRPGFIDLLNEIVRVWHADRQRVVESAAAVTERLRQLEVTPPASSIPGDGALKRTVGQFRYSFDARNGGFGDAPKFPRPTELLFLLREHARTGDAEARQMVVQTLHAMARGGMRDHIGGGFHRYSVDARWRVPHFEKMLYDQAQLVLAYVEGGQAASDTSLFDVAEDTLRYVLRDMTDAGGGFYSAEDADSIPPEHADDPKAHKAEGAFYLWTADELDALLAADADLVKRHFGVERHGNAPADPQQEFVGKNILYVARTVPELAADTGRDETAIADLIRRARQRLFEVRLPRPRPHLDDKILTAWNGLMIAAFARAARVLRTEGDRRAAASQYLEAARRAASFIRDRMWTGGPSTLLRRFRDGHAEIEGYAEDYAYLIFGLLELFQADADVTWLQWALTLQRRQDELFWDDAAGGWFSTTGRDPHVLLRMKEDYDGAEPTASSVSMMNLLVLSHLVDDPQWTERIERTFRAFALRLDQAGRAVPMMAAALATFVAGPQQIVIVRGTEGRGATDLERAVAARYLPFATTLSVSAAQQHALGALLPLVASMKSAGPSAAAYVCQNFSCRPPATTIPEFDEALGNRVYR
jgi:uncharacterized protein YyaL (SSP411 family)